ncbi:MAG: PEP-CTERM sorting domain-containing protein [Nitrosospira sp.]
MKKTLLGRKLSQVGVAAAVAGLFATAPMQAQAVALEFKDLNPTGGFISLDKLNTISSPQYFSAATNLAIAGGVNTLDVGDTFSQHLSLLTNSSSLGGGIQNFALGGDYRFDVLLNGAVTNTIGAPITLNPDNTVTSPAGSIFDVAFTSGTISLFDNVTSTHITDLLFQSGAISGIQLVAGSFIGDVTINTLLGGANCTPGACDPYILNGSGGTLAGVGLELFTITTGSARVTDGTGGSPASFAGSDFATHSLVVNFQDNGQSTTFNNRVPEPASLALIGIGLLGFAATRRGKKFI